MFKALINQHVFTGNLTTESQEILYSGGICGIKHYDLPYIYHHLQKGSKVSLVLERGKSVAVYYRNFKLGYLPVGIRVPITEQVRRGFELNCRIAAVTKKKYLPIDSIILNITLP